MPQHETAFATTVHKAQGSEFGAVVVMLPEHGSPVLSRELAYTAVTRAKAVVGVASAPRTIEQAITLKSKQASGLTARLHNTDVP
jgi:exodeoxyribonuclease V alpha subunit